MTREGLAPMRGVKVLDLTDETGVFGARLLADLGADVLRVERSDGDAVRRRKPFLHGQEGPDRSLAHLLYNGGKRSLAIAYDSEEAWAIVEPLLDWADVAVGPMNGPDEVFRYLNPARLAEAHPRLGLVDIVFRRGADRVPVSDLVGAAAGGLTWLNGFPEDPPNHPAGQLAYKQASLAAAFAAISLVTARRRGTKQRVVSVSMQEAVTWTTIQSGNQTVWAWESRSPGRTGGSLAGGQSVFQAKDCSWVSFVIPPPYWSAYVGWIREVIGDDHLDGLDGDAWNDPGFRLGKGAQIANGTRLLCATLTRDELVAEGQRRHLLVCPVNTVSDLAGDPHLNAREFFEDVWQPSLGETVRLPGSPFRSNRFRAGAMAAPRLGEHSEQVLTDILRLDPERTAQALQHGHVLAPAAVAR